MIADLNLDAAKATAREIRRAASDAFAVAMNVVDEAEVEKGDGRPMEKYGRVDVLVSNAGIQIVNPIVDFTFADWKQMLAIHLDGAFLTTRACLKHMYAGQVAAASIYMGSVHSKEASVLKAPYVTAKHGLIGLCQGGGEGGSGTQRPRQRSLPGFRAHAAGGQADPRAGQGARHQRGGRHQARDAEGDGGRRIHHGDDVADAVLFFAGSRSNALTGQSMIVSHGWFMQ